MHTPWENIQPSDLQVACTWRLHGDHQVIWYHRFILNPTSELFPELILMSLISALTSVGRAWALHWQVQIHKDEPKGIHPTADLNWMLSSTHLPNLCPLILIQCPTRKATLDTWRAPHYQEVTQLSKRPMNFYLTPFRGSGGKGSFPINHIITSI